MISEETIAEVKAKHPGVDLHLLTAEDKEFICKVPSPVSWRAFRKMASDDTLVLEANESLCFQHIVYPSPTELRKIIDAQPGLVKPLGNEIGRIAGAAVAVTSKKL